MVEIICMIVAYGFFLAVYRLWKRDGFDKTEESGIAPNRLTGIGD